jgi:hypothetical protein
VDEHGRIAWMKIYELRQQPDTAEILDALEKLT